MESGPSIPPGWEDGSFCLQRARRICPAPMPFLPGQAFSPQGSIQAPVRPSGRWMTSTFNDSMTEGQRTPVRCRASPVLPPPRDQTSQGTSGFAGKLSSMSSIKGPDSGGTQWMEAGASDFLLNAKELQTLAMFCQELDGYYAATSALGQQLQHALEVLPPKKDCFSPSPSESPGRSPLPYSAELRGCRASWLWTTFIFFASIACILWPLLFIFISIPRLLVTAGFGLLFAAHLTDALGTAYCDMHKARWTVTVTHLVLDGLVLAVLTLELLLESHGPQAGSQLLHIFQLGAVVKACAHFRRVLQLPLKLHYKMHPRSTLGIQLRSAALSHHVLALLVASSLAPLLTHICAEPSSAETVATMLVAAGPDWETMVSHATSEVSLGIMKILHDQNVIYNRQISQPMPIQCHSKTGVTVCVSPGTSAIVCAAAYTTQFFILIGLLAWLNLETGSSSSMGRKGDEEVQALAMDEGSDVADQFTNVGSELWLMQLSKALQHLQEQAQRIAKHSGILPYLRRFQQQQSAGMLAQTRFMMAMSHELRTPIAGILGHVELLRDTLTDPEQRHSAHVIQLCCEALLHRVNGILQLSQLGQADVVLEVLPFALEELVEDVFAVADSELITKKLKVSMHVDADLPTHVLGDVVKIRQVLMNLLNNAVRFTPHSGEVCICVRRVALDEMPLSRAFSAKDVLSEQSPTPRAFSSGVSAFSPAMMPYLPATSPVLPVVLQQLPKGEERMVDGPSHEVNPQHSFRWLRFPRAPTANSMIPPLQPSSLSCQASSKGVSELPQAPSVPSALPGVQSVGTVDASPEPSVGEPFSAEVLPQIGILFEVIDNGVGIPPSKQHSVFQPFVQADEGSTRKYGGCGLGLALSKALVEAMNGSIRLQSPAMLPEQTISNVGTKVSFVLPLQVAFERQPSERIPSMRSNILVLLLISNDRVRLQTSNSLTALGLRWRMTCLSELKTMPKVPTNRFAVVVDEDDILDQADNEALAPLRSQGLVLTLTLGARAQPNTLAKPLSRGRLARWLEKTLCVTITPYRRPSIGDFVPRCASVLSSRTSISATQEAVPAVTAMRPDALGNGDMTHFSSMECIDAGQAVSISHTPGANLPTGPTTPLLACLLGSFAPQLAMGHHDSDPSCFSCSTTRTAPESDAAPSPVLQAAVRGPHPVARRIPSPRAATNLRRTMPITRTESYQGARRYPTPPQDVSLPSISPNARHSLPHSPPCLDHSPLAPSGSLTENDPVDALVAEDNPVLQAIMRQHLKSLNRPCHICSTGQEVLDWLAKHWCPVIFMDYHMPEMDGVACTRMIRQQEQSGQFPGRPPIRIVATTADMTPQTQEICLAAGMDTFLCKPVTRKDIASVL